MKPKKPTNEPNAREKLSTSLLKALENDFALYGIETIEKLRDKSPEKYLEIASRLIATTEPKNDSLAAAKDMREVAVILLKRCGAAEVDITESMIEDAITANNKFVDTLQAICVKAEARDAGAVN
jgi:hypothetical protein